MIFVTVGSQKFQFDRLIKEVDRLVEKGIISDEVIAQIGASNYLPKFIKWERFMDKSVFDDHICKCDLLITHAGEGSIMAGLLNNKKVIAVPRYAKLGEHVSDHQLEIARVFAKKNNLINIENITDLETVLINIDSICLEQYFSESETLINSICQFIG